MFVTLAALASAAAITDLDHRTRGNTMLNDIRSSLHDSGKLRGVATRPTMRASADSTFARFLAGQEQPKQRSPPVTYANSTTAGARFKVTDFGADPTGATDSSNAFDLAVHSMLKLGNTSSGNPMGDGIANLGDQHLLHTRTHNTHTPHHSHSH